MMPTKVRRIRPGCVFSGKWFKGMIEVISICENELKVLLTSDTTKSQWEEIWDLEITKVGFTVSNGDYFWQDDFDGYPPRRLGDRDNELLADFMIWSGGHKPEECNHRELMTYCKLSLPASLGYSSNAARIELLRGVEDE